MDKPEPLITPEEAARILGVRVRTIHALVRERKLSCVQETARIRKFTGDQLREFIESRTIPLPKIVDRKSADKLPFSRKGGVQSKSTGDLLSERAKMRDEVRSWL